MDINALLEWLVKSSWQASLLVGLIIAAQRLLRRWLTPGWNYGLWFLVVMRLVLPSLPQSSWSVFNLTRVWRSQPGSVVLIPSPKVGEAAPSEVPIASNQLRDEREWNFAPNPPGLPSVIFPSEAAFPLVRSAGVRRFDLEDLLAGGWAMGFLFCAIRLLYQNARFVRKLRGAKPVTDPTAMELLTECRRALNIRSPLGLLETAEVKSPALYGLFRTRLLLPKGMLKAYSARELRYVFLHECAHVKRWDMPVNWLISLLEACHWFNPILWFAFRRMRIDREPACDAMVLARTPDEEIRGYGETILKILVGMNRSAGLSGLVGIVEDKQQIKNRLRLIARFSRVRSWSILAVATFAILVLVSLTDAQSKKPFASAATDQTDTPEPLIPLETAPAPIPPSTSKPDYLAVKALINSGKLDEAELQLRKAIGTQPIDNQAAFLANAIKDARNMQDSLAREGTTETLSPDELPKTSSSPQQPAQPDRRNSPSTARARIERRLARIRLKQVAYDRIPLSEVVRDLSEQSRRSDPERIGVNFILNSESEDALPSGSEARSGTGNGDKESLLTLPITLRAQDGTLFDVLTAIAAQTPIRYSIEEYAVVLKRGQPAALQLFTRVFKVDPDTMIGALGGDIRTATGQLNGPALAEKLRSFLMKAGADFSNPQSVTLVGYGAAVGATELPFPDPRARSIVFNVHTGLILARAEMPELDAIEKAVQVLNSTPPAVTVEAKLIEFNPENEKSFDWSLGMVPMSTAGNPSLEAPSAPARLGTSRVPVLGDIPLARSSIRNESGGQSSNPSVATVTGILTDPQFQAVVQALNQAPPSKTLFAPKVTTLSGRNATLETLDNREGCALEVLPRVAPDGQSTSIDLTFTLTKGWSAKARPPQPADNPLRIQTTLLVANGETVYLGPFPLNDGSDSGTKKAKRSGMLLVTATISSSKSLRATPGTVSVLGSVKREGVVELPPDQKFDLLEGIARAGGFTPPANKNKIDLTRAGKTMTYRFNDLKQISDPARKIWLEPGDLIYVHEIYF